MKTKTAQIKAFMLLAIFAINMAALCSCGFARPSAHHSMMKMDKDCCCCRHDTQKKDCKDNHIVQFNQTDKLLAQHFAIHPLVAIKIFSFIPAQNRAVIKVITVFKSIPFIDTSPPDLRILYRSFLI